MNKATILPDRNVAGATPESCDKVANSLPEDGVIRQKKENATRDINQNGSPKTKRRLVIFDKDGTLICVHKTLGPWLKEYIARLEEATGLVLADKIFNAMRFDNNKAKFQAGGFAEMTTSEYIDKIIQCIAQEGIPREKVERIAHECWRPHEQTTDGKYRDVHPIGDVGALFRVLKSSGYLIAVNTSDDRGITEYTLDHLNLRQYVDMIVCGDDEGVLPKPHPWTAQKICSELKVEPSDVIMIGDSPSDMKYGRNAGFRCSIGVLTGVTSREALAKDAMHVVEDIHHTLDLILKAM